MSLREFLLPRKAIDFLLEFCEFLEDFLPSKPVLSLLFICYCASTLYLSSLSLIHHLIVIELVGLLVSALILFQRQNGGNGGEKRLLSGVSVCSQLLHNFLSLLEER